MFKRPPGYFAGTLIEEAGLKGYKVGGAQVSPKHAGFVVNCGNATAADVLQLIADVRRVIMEKAGVELHPEVLVIGEEKSGCKAVLFYTGQCYCSCPLVYVIISYHRKRYFIKNG